MPSELRADIARDCGRQDKLRPGTWAQTTTRVSRPSMRFLELLTAGRPVPRALDDSAAPKTITLQELELLIKQNKKQ